MRQVIIRHGLNPISRPNYWVIVLAARDHRRSRHCGSLTICLQCPAVFILLFLQRISFMVRAEALESRRLFAADLSVAGIAAYTTPGKGVGSVVVTNVGTVPTTGTFD